MAVYRRQNSFVNPLSLHLELREPVRTKSDARLGIRCFTLRNPRRTKRMRRNALPTLLLLSSIVQRNRLRSPEITAPKYETAIPVSESTATKYELRPYVTVTTILLPTVISLHTVLCIPDPQDYRFRALSSAIGHVRQRTRIPGSASRYALVPRIFALVFR